MPRRASAHSRLLAVGLCLVIVGCAAPGDTDRDGGRAGQSSDAGEGGGDGGDGSGGEATSSEGPITIVVDGHSFGYDIGRCEVIEGVVYAQARAGDFMASIEVTLPEWDRDIAHSRRYGSIYAGIAGDGGVPQELVASRSDAGTTWDWTVSGSQVEVTAVTGNRSTATRGESGLETFTEYPQVTITMDCQGIFGTGFPESEPMHEDFFLLDPPTDRVPGTVTIDLESAMYTISYLTTCQLFSNDVTAEGVADEAYVYLYSEGRGVDLDLSIGDLREPKSLQRWTLPPDASLQSDFPFEGSDTTRTWTGDVVSESGAEAEATITVECTEGDAFDSAGTGSIVVDGVPYELDEVSSCSISAGTIEFFGRQSAGPVAVVVTSGGSDILFGDDTGQTVTSGVAFTISGQQATWTGVLSGNRQATVAIDCG